jgi:cellulose synthase/poly-beta-1,6-N-acetylglucosamine synthase-like glycosyltransferase
MVVVTLRRATVLRGIFWTGVAAIAWTHAGYPATLAVVARRRPMPVRKGDITPPVTVLVAAHDEEAVIARRIENLLGLEYPADLLEIVVVSDGSTDATDAIVERLAASSPRVHLLRAPRGGKLGALNMAVRYATGDVLAFSDANTVWAPEALANLVRCFADDDVGYVCGRLELLPAEGSNRDGVYWRFELWLREQESAVGSITGGNGAIYAVRRRDWAEQSFGHDLGLPHEMVKRGRRAVYEPAAVAFEKQSRELEDEYRRKVRMLRWSWQHLLEGRMLRSVDPLYRFQVVSHRLLRYSLGGLHLAVLGSSLALARRRPLYRAALSCQLAWLGAAGAGRLRLRVPGAGVAFYYLLMVCATLEALARYLRSGVPLVWEKAEGTR